MEKNSITVCVTDAPYLAAGDGKTNDRAAIQQAIDEIFALGGGTVLLTAGRTFLSAGLVLRSGVTLRFGDGAVLLQSPCPDAYVKPQGDGYEPYTPRYGHNFSETIKWSHNWYWNYPLLFAPQGTHDFAVCGNGVIRMMEVTDPEKIMKICPIGFYRCSHFEISDVQIVNYHSYAIMPLTCDHGLIRNVQIKEWSYGNGDGVCLMNCQHIRVTGCSMFTGDDSVYIFSSYRDPRKSEWWSSDDPQPSIDIEIDHNDLKSNHCKAFGMILWGITCPDLEKTEVRDVYVHDNHLETMGNWLYNPYSDKAGDPPVTHVRFENNTIDGIESNFFETQIGDMNYFRSMTQMHNGNFSQGRVFWSMRGTGVGVCRNTEDGTAYGYIGAAQQGESALYQGLYIEKDHPCIFRAEVSASGEPCRMFVRRLDGGEAIAELIFDNRQTEEKILHFTVPESGNYHIGIERVQNGGAAQIRSAVFGYHAAAFGYDKVIFDRGKVVFQYNDNLFRR